MPPRLYRIPQRPFPLRSHLNTTVVPSEDDYYLQFFQLRLFLCSVRYQSEGKTLGKVFRTLRPNFLILLLPREDQLLPSYKEWLRSLSRWPPTKFRASLPPVFVQLPLACSLPVSFPESHLVMKDARHGKYDQNSKWRSTGR